VVVIKLNPVLVVRERSIRNPVSFEELSVQVKLIVVEDTAEAANPDGAVGATESVVALASDVYAELPPALVDRMR
jgi:hypothetical protein